MSPGPGDEKAAGAARRGRLLASHADREQVIDVLKAAFVQGRLTKDEFDLRVGQTFVSRTYAGLAAITADIPAEPPGDQPPHTPAQAQARPPMSNGAKAALCVVIAVATMVVATILTRGYALVVFVPFYLMGLLVTGAQMLASRYEKRSHGRLPLEPGPDPGSSRRTAST
jgi:hypothetical protein